MAAMQRHENCQRVQVLHAQRAYAWSDKPDVTDALQEPQANNDCGSQISLATVYGTWLTGRRETTVARGAARVPLPPSVLVLLKQRVAPCPVSDMTTGWPSK